ncbi:LysR family transcriptional regulator [Psychromonas ossibalaenae]|uniref:LysR family transcriptional regulator n=1 Tax=Psychromonas ossibalaenae TaxID=444922 RepID=UPI0005257BC9|nr:LysR family transcriptional regulator [Psychromonas ossibalaenae]
MKTEDIKLFHQVVDAGSLVRASEIFELPKSNISRRIKTLEEELNILLFHRQNRALQLTDSGIKFYEKTKAMLNELEASIQEICAPTYEVSGHLRIQLLPLPDTLDIGRQIFQFMDMYPKISVEIINSSEDKNLVENHIDVAMRIGETLEDSSLIARPFGKATFGYYATPQYIEKNGAPQSAEELQKLNVIRYRFPNGQIYSQLPFGKESTVEVSGNLIMNSVPLIIEACLQNRGIIFIPEKVANFYVERGLLVRIFNDIEPSINHCWLVYASRKHLSLATRTFINYILQDIDGREEMSDIDSDVRGMTL